MYSVVLMAALTAGTSTPAWCHGCHGCHGCWSICHGCSGGYVAAAPVMGTPVVTTDKSTPAKLVVEVPADAKLYVDDQLMKTTAARRVFNTPTLEKGQTYYYILRAEMAIDGKTVSETK